MLLMLSRHTVFLFHRAWHEHRSLSEAGRTLFAASRTKKTARNDADRLKKYLARVDLTFGGL